MAVSLGIAVGADRIRAVALKAGRIVAATEAEVGPGDSLSAAIAELLATAPLPRFPRPKVVVALGPSLAQTRRIAGLPPLEDGKLLAQMVREGSGKFFLRNGVPLATTGVRIVAPGTVWAAALDERAVRAVETGCRSAGVRVDRFVPAVAVLGRALVDTHLMWPDGGSVAEVRLQGGELESVRRIAAAQAPAGAPPEAVPALARLGEHGWRFADAYGAASLPDYEPMVLRATGAGADDVPRWRMALAGGALAASLLFAAVAPAIKAMRAEDAAAGRIAAVQDRRRAASDTERELERVTQALAEAAAFDADRYSPTLLLADLTAALPQGSAVVAFTADTANGSVVALAPRAAAVVQPLEKVPGIVAPEIVGPVTREALAGRDLERVTIRFGIDAERRARPRTEAAP
ncbi:MAG TPA: hypothetical protein VGC13_00075 [Longimicrobium sp.]|jgi:hypothetical protein|uniref:hypothetical protein n=1 Tax=Longimicrobium sp. TaxID=2029185 RepID=UPI002ED971D1